MYKLIIALTTAALISLLPQGIGNAEEAWGPAIGSELPHSLASVDTSGQSRDFDSIVGENGVVLVFVRSLDWCPFCKRQIIELGDRAGEFNALGYPLVSISYDDPSDLKAFEQEFGIDFPLLSDGDSAIIDAFGIRNEDYEPGTSGYGIPHPGIVVVDPQRVIRAKFREQGYKLRPKVDDVLAAIKGL